MKLKKYHFVTLLLTIYALFMILYFGLDLLKEGHVFRFYATLIGEVIVVILTFFALRKRDRLRKEKKEKNVTISKSKL